MTDEVATRFGRRDLAPLWAAVRDRLERAGSDPVRSVRLVGLAPAQRRAVAELLGLDRVPPATTTVPLARLDAVVGQAVPGLDARTVVERLGGPVVDRRAVRERRARDRAALWDWLASHPQVTAEPALAGWVAAVRSGGVVGGSVAATRELLEQALVVLAALPSDGRPLPSFADAVCADPHALDDGTRLAGLVVRALASLRGVDPPADAQGRRALWEAFGVAGDHLSTAVLAAGLRPQGDGPLAATLRAWADAGEAAWVTLAQLRSSPAVRVTDRVVWVVENPSVVAEALRRFGPGCPPLVCTSGWPTLAGVELLRALAAGGAALHYHGDLDGEGIRIAAHTAARTGAQPWGMAAADYAGAARDDGPAVGRVTDAPWDPGLAPAMRARGVAVPQEQRCAALLDAMVHREPGRPVRSAAPEGP